MRDTYLLIQRYSCVVYKKAMGDPRDKYFAQFFVPHQSRASKSEAFANLPFIMPTKQIGIDVPVSEIEIKCSKNIHGAYKNFACQPVLYLRITLKFSISQRCMY